MTAPGWSPTGARATRPTTSCWSSAASPGPAPTTWPITANFDLDDNRIENLRWITKSLCLSRRQCWYVKGVSGYKHVVIDSARRHQFRAVVRTQSGKHIYRSGFKTAEAAYGEALAIKLEHHWID